MGSCASVATATDEKQMVDVATIGDASALVSLFGETLNTHPLKGVHGASAAKVSTAEALAGKTVGIYFSAHWCPPCRSFTPMLAKAYTSHLKSKNFEIVFVSSDQD